MNYWWVNQKQTYRHEIGDGDGYLWSPKKQSNGKTNFSYEYMKSVLPGDIVFSYAKSSIIAIGVAQTHCYSFPKPIEFCSAGLNWSQEGWKVDVKYTKLLNPVRTIDRISQITHLLPRKYSPISSTTGHGNQAYLFKIDRPLAIALANMIDNHAIQLISQETVRSETNIDSIVDMHIWEWEERIELQLENDTSLNATERKTLINARVGQGRFRRKLLAREKVCRVTGVDKSEHLVASHIKPWRSSENAEKVDPENGFMLTPTIDHLFDKGFISFENNGELILSDNADRSSMRKLGVIERLEKIYVPAMSTDKKHYLQWHRENILL